MISREYAILLLKTEGCSDNIITHCIDVSTYALDIGKKVSRDHEVDLNLIEIGGLLHDIGRSKINGILHGVIGADILRNKGIDEKIALICERHVGSGISNGDIEKFKLPQRKYVPETLEEKIVCHADNFFINGKKVSFEMVYERFINEFGKDHPSIQRLILLQKDLGKYL